jgi:hypothetical protein
MPELSNLLKNGLAKASQEAGVHPDADLLTAYAEQILTSSERSQVLEHLAACRQCRDVVSLALEPAAEERAPVLVATPRRRWFLTPQFALVAAVAAMAVGVGIVMRLQPSQPAVVQEAKAVPPAAANSGSADSSPAQPGSTKPDSAQPGLGEKDTHAIASAAVPPPKGMPAFAGNTASDQKVAGTRSLQVEARQAEARNAPLKDTAGKASASAAGPASPANRPEPKKKDAGAGGRAQLASAAPSRQDYVNLQMFASDASYQGASGGDLPSAPSPAPAASTITQARALAGGPPTIFADIPNNAVKQSQRGMTLYQPPAARESAGLLGKIADVGKHMRAKRLGPAIPAEAIKSFAMASGAPPTDQAAEVAAARAPAKPESMTLKESSAFSANGLRGRSNDQWNGGLRWSVDHGKLYDEAKGHAEMTSVSGMEFSTVWQGDAEVWAGGSHAALIHSSDGGATWEKIALGDSATGTVVNIEVSGANVVVKTSSNQTWTSHDGGKSWGMN